MFGSFERSPTHAWISTRLVLETLLIWFALAAASAAAYNLEGWPRALAVPPLLLALGLWLDRMFNVGHEAVHRKLFPDHPRWNDLLGALMFAPLLAPFAVVRKIHGFHHGHNRRAPGVATLDVVLLPPGPAWRRGLTRAWGSALWFLAVFAGGFFLHSLVSVLLFLLLPTDLARIPTSWYLDEAARASMRRHFTSARWATQRGHITEAFAAVRAGGTGAADVASCLARPPLF